MDIRLGFHQIAKFNYYPGWHQQISCSEFLMNKEKFDALPDEFQAMIEVAAGKQVIETYARTEFSNPKSMNEMLSEHGVTNKRWSDADLAVLEKAWNEVLDEVAQEDELFAKAAASYKEFRALYRTWGDAQALGSTYLQ